MPSPPQPCERCGELVPYEGLISLGEQLDPDHVPGAVYAEDLLRDDLVMVEEIAEAERDELEGNVALLCRACHDQVLGFYAARDRPVVATLAGLLMYYRFATLEAIGLCLEFKGGNPPFVDVLCGGVGKSVADALRKVGAPVAYLSQEDFCASRDEDEVCDLPLIVWGLNEHGVASFATPTPLDVFENKPAVLNAHDFLPDGTPWPL